MKRLFLIFLTFMTLLLQSCRPLDYGDKYENVRWTSTYPNIEFTVYNKTDGKHLGTIYQDNENIEIIALWSLTNGLYLYNKDKVDSLLENEGLSENEIAIKGQYKIWRNQGVVKMHVDIDNVFNFKYEYITFVMSEL